MKKNIFLFLCLFFLTSLFIIGCSKKDITKVSLVEDSIKHDYLIEEEVLINEFKVEVTFKNNSKKKYKVDSSMFSLGEIDNTKLGKQDLEIFIDYKGNKVNLITEIVFSLPLEVEEVVNGIKALEELEIIDFKYEKDIIEIDNIYNNLSENNKALVYNAEILNDIKEKMNNIKTSLITTSVLNERILLIDCLEKKYFSLNKSDYDNNKWTEITNIYNEVKEKLELDENYNKMRSLFLDGRERIDSVKTISENDFEKEVFSKIEQLRSYKMKFPYNLYTNEGRIQLDNILIQESENMKKAFTIKQLNDLYDNAVIKLNDVMTINEENLIKFEIIKSNRIIILNEYYNDIIFEKYSKDNCEKIFNKYIKTLNLISHSSNEEQISRYILDFKNYYNEIPTIEDEEVIRIANAIIEKTKIINNYYKSIDLYEYDSTNISLIKKIVSDSISILKQCSNIDEMDNIVQHTIEQLDNVLTMSEQTLQYLSNRINNAMNEVDIFYSNLDSNIYSEQNWSIIFNKVTAAKSMFNDEIKISTSNETINTMINNLKEDINDVLTIEEEYIKLINDTKISSKNELTNYIQTLNMNDFSSQEWTIVLSRIENAKEQIDLMDNINNMNELVRQIKSLIEASK